MAGFRLTSSSHNVNLWIVPLKMSLAVCPNIQSQHADSSGIGFHFRTSN
jgi:hypothetical protein